MTKELRISDLFKEKSLGKHQNNRVDKTTTTKTPKTSEKILASGTNSYSKQ